MNSLGIECRLAWWWWPYYYGVLWMVIITGCEADMEKVYSMLFKAVRVRYADGSAMDGGRASWIRRRARRRWRALRDVNQ